MLHVVGVVGGAFDLCHDKCHVLIGPVGTKKSGGEPVTFVVSDNCPRCRLPIVLAHPRFPKLNLPESKSAEQRTKLCAFRGTEPPPKFTEEFCLFGRMQGVDSLEALVECDQLQP